MYLFISVLGKDIAKPFKKKTDGNNDFFEFGYYREVFDLSDNFEQTSIEEIAGGTWKNGVTTIHYTSKSGCKLTLDIDGGFPIPELADMTLEVDSLTDKNLEDIICAFEKYHETKFTHFHIECDGKRNVYNSIFTIIQLFAEDPNGLRSCAE